MKAILCTQYGPPEDLQFVEIADPVAGPGEVLVDLHASSINFPDLLKIQGLYQAKSPLPFVPGSEGAGVVTAIGSSVAGFSLGDHVAVLPQDGAFAEKVAVRADLAMRLPSDFPMDFAAAFLVTYGTAYLSLIEQAGLQSGETVLVLGASGGVGVAAIEIAKASGATVIAAASTAEKLAFAAEAGADHLVNYEEVDLKSVVRSLTDGRGVDIVFDPVGDRFSEPALRSLAWRGRFLVIGFAAGEIARVPLNLLLLKSASAIGVFYGEWASRNPEANSALVTRLLELWREGAIRAPISKRFALENVPAALRWIGERRATGKLLVEIRDLSEADA